MKQLSQQLNSSTAFSLCLKRQVLVTDWEDACERHKLRTTNLCIQVKLQKEMHLKRNKVPLGNHIICTNVLIVASGNPQFLIPFVFIEL